MEEEKAITLTTSRAKCGPMAKHNFDNLDVEESLRHVPEATFVEPKVYSPYKSRTGQIPRQIVVERKKRQFTDINISDAFKEHGILDQLRKYLQNTRKDSVEGMPLSYFDNTFYHSRPVESWFDYVEKSKKEGGLKARALYYQAGRDSAILEWRHCHVVDYDRANNTFTVIYDTSELHNAMKAGLVTQFGEAHSAVIDSIYVCFNVEDPELYFMRIEEAVRSKERTAAGIALSLYIDCMPVDNLKPLDSEQVNRILTNAINMDKLRHNSMLDTSTLLQQYNLNHMKTLNQMMFVNLLKKQQKELQSVKSVSVDVTLFQEPETIFKIREKMNIECDVPFDETVRSFKFASLWSKPEAMQILLQLQIENAALEKAQFFVMPEKSQRLEEFNTTQQAAAGILTQTIKDTWCNAIIASVKLQLKDVKKGWFNIEENNLEVYKFSKLKKFLLRINFRMEDTLRDLMYRMVNDYCAMIYQFLPSTVSIKSRQSVVVTGNKFPLFTADLKFLPAKDGIDAKFAYTTTPDAVLNAVLAHFDNPFKSLKGMTKIERKVMKKIFWAYDPVIGVPHTSEDWALQLRNQLAEKVSDSLKYMDMYLSQLDPFIELVLIDINQYAEEAEERFFSKEAMNMAELSELAQKHASESEDILNNFPATVSLGFIQIDCKSVRTMLAAKHKAISTKLFQLLEKKTRDFAESVINDFRSMYDVIVISPTNIEKLTELRETMTGMPQRVEHLTDKIEKNTTFFELIEKAKWQLPFDILDLRWEVFRWPQKMNNEIAKQEKNLRVLEYQFKRSMEEEQQDFATDLQNLQSDVSKLKELTKLSHAAKNAETVRRIRVTLTQCEDKSRLFNSREGLFNATITEYSELSEVSKIFEPFFDLWDSADKWFSQKEDWTNGPFLGLDAEALENSVNLLLKNLSKAAKSLERNNLPQCSAIATQVRDELEHFRPNVPLITALRNPGMRDRHWNELSAKLNVKLPEDRKNLTLQMLVDLGLSHHMNEVEKTAEKAGKEFSIETALDKMTKAWESVQLIIEPYRDTGTCILKGVDDYMSLLDEHITMTQVCT